MTRAKRYAAPAALLLAFALCTPATVRADDFDAVVKNVRAACGGKKVRIPFLGLLHGPASGRFITAALVPANAGPERDEAHHFVTFGPIP